MVQGTGAWLPNSHQYRSAGISRCIGLTWRWSGAAKCCRLLTSVVRHRMKTHECPSCLQPSFTLWQKLSLGPAKKIRCELCGAAVSVAWIKSMSIILLGCLSPPFGAVVAFLLLPQPVGLATFVVSMLIGAAVGLALLGSLYSRWVPLVIKHD